MTFWLSGYTTGLQYFHLNQGFLKDFSISADKISKWGVELWAFLLFPLTNIMGSSGFAVYLFVQAGCGMFQAVLFFALLFGLIGTNLALWRMHDFHLHHYFVAMMVIPMCWFPHPVMIWFSAWYSGVLDEGAARWGYDPVWSRKNQSDERDGPEQSESDQFQTKKIDFSYLP